jgi:hypothetical protein
LALPVAALDYATAGWWWNVASLALLVGSLIVVARTVGWQPHPLTIITSLGLLMVWVPLWLHTLQGQLGLVLLAVFVAAWSAGRAGYWGWAGGLIGLAATIKLFPILLLGVLALLGRWRGVTAGIVTTAAISAGTAVIVGPQAFVDYATTVVPQLNRWRADWINSSLTGYVAHLFAPDPTIVPLLPSPVLATGLTLATSCGVIAIIAHLARQCGQHDFDGIFALALTGLLLLSALTWSHYFVVLLLPLLIWLPRLIGAGHDATGRWLVLIVTWLLMAVPQLDLALAIIGQPIAGPQHALTVLATNFYGLLGFFLAQAWWLKQDVEVRVVAADLATDQRSAPEPTPVLVGPGVERIS